MVLLSTITPPITQRHILTINGGSSSIRFAVYENAGSQRRIFGGKVDRIGLTGSTLTITTPGLPSISQATDASDHHAALTCLLSALEAQSDFSSIIAVGHRVVHGMAHTEPERITDQLLDELRSLTLYDPDHLPREIELIEAFGKRYPKLPQIACFDTAFHRTMPRVAKLLPIPRRYEAMGVQRYGFHGLSYSFLMEELTRLGEPAASKGRVILAHFGNGASVAAVLDGKSVDTSMGFTPAAGLVMSTRSGDLDPGLLSFLANADRMTVKQFGQMVNHESGLLGISETSSDVRDLLSRERDDVRAAEALELFCYQAKKWIGAYTAALGGLDMLVFTGGIGENSPDIRERICHGLGFLGIELNATSNAESATMISSETSRVRVRVIRTDEERMIARAVGDLLGLNAPSQGIKQP